MEQGEGVKEGDLTFVSGHPGRTQRLNTVADLSFMRDYALPARMQQVWRREVQLQTFSGRSKEWERIASGDLFGVQNGRKALTGRLAGLHDPKIMQKKIGRSRVLSPKLQLW